MPKTITVSQAELDKRAKEIAKKGFLLGVDWMCNVLIESDVFGFSHSDAEIFHKRAESVFK